MSNLQHDLRRAVRVLGGPHRTATLASVGRTKIEYWLYCNTPEWAQRDVERILHIASDRRNWKEPTNGQAKGHRKGKGKGKTKTRH